MSEQGFENNTNLVQAKCTNCGGELTVDTAQECAVCKFCGTPFIVSKAVQNYNVTHNNYTTNVVNDQRKGAVESLLDYKSRQEDKKYQRAEEKRLCSESKKKSRNRLILWILGWLFIFPVPLTILMLRNKTLRGKAKAGIIAGGWVLYLILMAVYGNSGDSGAKRETLPTDTTPSTAVTTTVEETTTATTTTVPETTTTAAPETTTTAETTKKKKKTTTAETEPPEPSDEDVRKAVNDGDYSLVTPEFKELMDSYEAFYDEYIAFMQKYNSGEGDLMQMLDDYSKMMERLDEWSRKMDEIDESKLSPADDAYYLLVTLRIEKKLVGAAI